MDLATKNQKICHIKVDLEKQEAFKKAYEELKSNLLEDESIYFMNTGSPDTSHQSEFRLDKNRDRQTH